MKPFEVDLRVLTPAFVRGRDERSAELRGPSIKGLLRWWYRTWNPLACDPESAWAEGRVMGGIRPSEGQCPFSLRLRLDEEPGITTWKDVETSARRGSRQAPGGLRYLGFSFGMKKDGGARDHRAIAPGTRFRAVHLFRRESTEEQARALVASWWLLTHLGGIGARSRRGFGGLVLEDWRWPEHAALLEALPLPATARRAREWEQRTITGLQVLKDWVPAPTGWPATAPCLGPGSRIVLRSDPQWRDWSAAMEDAGQVLANGRRQYRSSRSEIDDRVTFGLPLETGRRPRRAWRPGSFRRERIESDRHASPLHLHIGAWQGGVGQCWTLLDGPRPGRGDYRVREEKAKKSVRREAADAVAVFVDGLDGIRWEGAR